MLGTSELILILCVALLLFGGKRLPELARSLGHGLSEFKKAMSDDKAPSSENTPLNDESDQK